MLNKPHHDLAFTMALRTCEHCRSVQLSTQWVYYTCYGWRTDEEGCDQVEGLLKLKDKLNISVFKNV